MIRTNTLDASTILAEFGPQAAVGVQHEPGRLPLYRAHDGFGCSGFGASYAEAAANLRTARAEHARYLADLEAAEAEGRARLARVLANVAILLVLALAIAAGLLGGVRP